ncbi:chromosome partition protein Smc [Erysipelotrichaceae bacterium]|nr:chromosome partition protein Smc [Erysipelotrichaceae bacterium]
MFLKRIESYGFKSFANRVSIEFDMGMSAIVGPNGSGKSNVVDATRWVLGEQSAKTLRGGNMQDVIFKGSALKKQLGFAEVTLVLDNACQTLPLDFSEVSITRRLYRNGESVYLINSQKVRLQDLTNLFMDSGIGKESFSIIGQGRIDEILNSKPIDRRAIFEEAAGVLKYKTRKEQSLRRLEKTHENLLRVSDVIAELALQVEPLRIQSEVAKTYFDHKEKLQESEISVLSHEIKLLATQYDMLEKAMSTHTILLAQERITSEMQIQIQEQLESKIKALEDAIQIAQESLILITKDAEMAKGAQQMQEQKKEHLHEMIIQIEGDVSELTMKIQQVDQLALKSEHIEFEQNLAKKIADKKQVESKMHMSLEKLEQLKDEKNIQNGKYQGVSSRLQTLSEINDSLTNLFQGVRGVLQASKKQQLSGIHGTLIDIITVEAQYTKAIETSLASALQFIVTDNQKAAEQAIAFLKDQKLGKATFLPIDIIKSVAMSEQQQVPLAKMVGFIGIASDLLAYQPQYEQIILQQLGQTIIANNLEHANKIASAVQFRYRIVTLAGEIVHRGGSMTGGATRNEKTGLLSQKQDMVDLQEIKSQCEAEITATDANIAQQVFLLAGLKIQFEKSVSVLQAIQQKEHAIKQYMQQMLEQKQDVTRQVENLELRKSIYVEDLAKLQLAAVNLYATEGSYDDKKDEVITSINGLRRERLAIDNQKADAHKHQKVAEISERSLQKEFQKMQLDQNTAEVKASNTVMRLQETYNCSFESVKHLELDAPYEEVENRVSSIRKAIERMGPINASAIEEYARVSERFEYLTTQKADLDAAEENLLAIIADMDIEMRDRFAETFEAIQINFAETFKQLFAGGTAELKLEQKGEFLTSGIEIFTQPPGKKVQNLMLLSGGERALTAIALLFAILKTKPVPFCILDEVEAALDDANVDRFANYLKIFSKQTQFIVVTHRKGTMEYADVLYGVTMEEAGISKILSVRLKEATKLIEE